ncbi:MAG: hypothetical protein M5R36_25335 [Deltaproteobacteria bacterium]|nr:hypothetical protein [Deltaproteobacteria bacterium]
MRERDGREFAVPPDRRRAVAFVRMIETVGVDENRHGAGFVGRVASGILTVVDVAVVGAVEGVVVPVTAIAAAVVVPGAGRAVIGQRAVVVLFGRDASARRQARRREGGERRGQQ